MSKAISIVCAAYNEAGNIKPLCDEVVEAMGTSDYEFLIVDDGSKDSTRDEIEEATKSNSNIKLVKLQFNCGQAFAMKTGLEAAQYPLVAFLDADGQNNPADIPMMVDMLSDDVDMVCGWRKNRQDEATYKLSSKAGNALIRLLFGIKLNDIGCSLKVFKKEYLLDLHYFKNMHRYWPILAKKRGARLKEIAVDHRARTIGQSKYSSGKAFGVIKELAYLKVIYDPS